MVLLFGNSKMKQKTPSGFVLFLALLLALVVVTMSIRRRMHLPILPAFLRVAQPLPKGQCTWYAFGRAAEAGWKIRFDVNSGRHGRNWWDKVTNAKKSDTPSVGAVLVLDAWPGNEYGHVAYVEKVNSNDSFEITHANFAAGEPVAQREGITIYRAACTKSAEGISIAGGPVLPLRGFLVPIE